MTPDQLIIFKEDLKKAEEIVRVAEKKAEELIKTAEEAARELSQGVKETIRETVREELDSYFEQKGKMSKNVLILVATIIGSVTIIFGGIKMLLGWIGFQYIK